MRILILSTYFPPHVGGVEVVAAAQAHALAAAGHQVVVVTTASDPDLLEDQVIDGYRVLRAPAANALERRTGIPYPFVGPSFWRTLGEQVHWCEAVHLHDVLYQPPQAAAVLAARAGKPVYLTQHIGRVNHPSRLVSMISQCCADVAGGLLWRRARRILVHTSLVEDYLRQRGVPGWKMTRALPGVDTQLFTPGPASDAPALRRRFGLPADRPLVLFVGRLIEQKGHHLLTQAASGDFHVALVGSGAVPARLPDTVSCLGALDRTELRELYRLADVFALPSVGEVFPLVVQEAMSCGLPVLATDEPGYARYDLDRQLIRLVPARLEQVRTALRELCSDVELRSRMGRYSRRFAVEHFDARIYRQTLAHFYDADLDNGTRTGTRTGTGTDAAIGARIDTDPSRPSGRDHGTAASLLPGRGRSER